MGERRDRLEVCKGDPNSKPVRTEGEIASALRLSDGVLERPMSIQEESPRGGERDDLTVERDWYTSPELSLTLTALPFRLCPEAEALPFRACA